MRASFLTGLTAVLLHEGGYVNHPADPGGATNRGVTQKVYDRYRRNLGLPVRSVKHLTELELKEIYLKQYWQPVKADALPKGVDYAVFDFAVNSGVERAARMLQFVCGVAVDGNIGPMTLGAVNSRDPLKLIDALCDARQEFLESLSTFATFGKGWTRRVAGVRQKAKELANA